MKVYFTASLRGTQKFYDSYKKIYDEINNLGHTNLDDAIFKYIESDFYSGDHEDQIKHYERIMNFIKKSDVVILEVSVPSLSMGFILQKALEINKPVIALCEPNANTFFLNGIENEKLQITKYTINNLNSQLDDALNYAQESSDVRFNFFISPSIGSYLDWIAKKKKIPRSVYLRNLIEKDMEKNEDYGF